MLYPSLVFLHVVSAMGLFAAIGIETVALRGLRRETTPAGARASIDLFGIGSRVGSVSMLLILTAGIALMVIAWHRQPWITAAFIGIAAMAVLGGIVSGRRLRRVRASLAGETGPQLSAGFMRARSSGALVASQIVRIAIATGIVGLMTVKPDAAGSALILSAAALAGVIISIPAWTFDGREGEPSAPPTVGA